MSTLPLWTGTITRFGTVWHGLKLRLDANGSAAPSGYTVRNPPAVGPVAVTLRMAAVAPAGRRLDRSSCRALLVPIGRAVPVPVPSLVSRTRTGDCPLNPPPLAP